MNKIVSIVGVLVVIAAGFFGGKYLGLFGGEKVSSLEEISQALEAYAGEIKAEGGLAYGETATLVTATHIEKQITIRGNSTHSIEQLKEMFGDEYADKFLESSETMAAIRLCGDATMRAALAGGAYFVYHWFSSDNERVGGVNMRGATYCIDHGYLKATSE